MALLLCACGGGGGNGTSDPVPAAIVAQPISISAIAGAAATFSVTATGDGISYQWQRSTGNAATWVNVSGATSATFTLASVDVTLNGYQYRAVITGAANSIITSAVTLTVAAAVTAPSIAVPPADQSTVAGANASFSVTATGTSLTYQWQSSVDGTTWVNVSGAASATLLLTAVVPGDSGKQFRAVVSNSAGSVNSAAGILTVTAAVSAPTIVTQPAAVTVVVAQTATFTVAATGNPAPSYQWQQSADGGATFSDIASATSASYTTPATSSADSARQFRVRVSNSAGSLTSSAVVLTVNPLSIAPAITTQPANQSATAPGAATFTVAASGTPTPTFQWQLSSDGGGSFANINGATGAAYTTAATSSADGGKQFRVVVSNGVGSVTSNAATLTVTTAVASSLGGNPTSLTINSAGTLRVVVEYAYPNSSSALIQSISAAGNVSTFAGSTGQSLSALGGIAEDSGGNVYVISGSGANLLKVTPSGAISTFATGLVAGDGLTTDGLGNFYVTGATLSSCYVLKLSSTGVSTPLAGGSCGYADGTGAAAQFSIASAVSGAAVDAAGNVYMTDTYNAVIRKINSAGVVTTLAGRAGSTGFVDGAGSAARFFAPVAIAIDASGNLYVTDRANWAIRKVTPAGVVTTLAGGTRGDAFADGTGAAARFGSLTGIAVDSSGNVLVADTGNHAIRRITPAGVVTTLIR